MRRALGKRLTETLLLHQQESSTSCSSTALSLGRHHTKKALEDALSLTPQHTTSALGARLAQRLAQYRPFSVNNAGAGGNAIRSFLTTKTSTTVTEEAAAAYSRRTASFVGGATMATTRAVYNRPPILQQQQHRFGYRSFSATAAPIRYSNSSSLKQVISFSRPPKWFKRLQLERGFIWPNVVKPSYEYILGTGFNARVAIINALYAMQPSTNWARMLSLLIAEAITRGDAATSWCYKTPVTPQELQHLAAAEAADAAAANHKATFFELVKLWLSNTFRLVWLLLLFGPVVFLAPLAFNHGYRRKQWMTLLRQTLESAGPAFIKWGQWAATRHDLFPPDLCSELERLHTSAPAHSGAYTEAAIEAAFGFAVTDLFREFETVPLASGSIGQIHKGVLSGTGSRLTGMPEGSVVAIKVRHPSVSEMIERDFALMMAAARLASALPALKELRLEESLSQFAAPLREQVDLAREAYHLHAFNYNFRKTPGVSFPVPLYPLVAPSVLVESFEQGDQISVYIAQGPGAHFNSHLAQLGAHTMLHMMIVDNLIHADLHPGNILVRLEPVGGRAGAKVKSALTAVTEKLSQGLGVNLHLPPYFLLKPRMVLLDAGMATHLSPEDQVNMVGLFEAFSRLDGQAVADWTLRFAGEEQTCPDPQGFMKAVEYRFNTLKEAEAFAPGDTSNGAEALADVLEDVRLFQVNLPGHIVATVVTTLVLEGWSFNLDPEHSTLEEVKRVIKAKRGETITKWAAAWVASAAEREILEHVPRFEPAPPSTSTLWAWMTSWKDGSSVS